MYKLLILIMCLSSSILEAQFIQINTGTTNDINSIREVDDQIFFLGHNYLSKTVDFGANLIDLNVPTDLPNTYALNVVDTSNLYLISSNPGVFQIMKSSDGADTWNIIFDTTSIAILDLKVNENGRILAVGTFGNVFTSLNGIDWTILNAGNITVIEQCEILSDSMFLVGGFQYTGLSADTGATWNVSMYNTSHCSKIFEVNADTIYLSSYFWNGWESFFSKSYDGGSHWSSSSLGTGIGIYDIEFVSSLEGYAVGYNYNDSLGIVMHTFDAGTTWETFYTSYNSEFLDIEIIEDSLLFLAGTNGVLLKTNHLNLGLKDVSSTPVFEVFLYPNPSNSFSGVTVATNKRNKYHATLFDSNGKIKGEYEFKDELKIDNIFPGIYFISVTDQNFNSVTKKLMIE